MDLVFDQDLSYERLATFLQVTYAAESFFLLYPGITGWDDVPQKRHAIAFQRHEDQVGAFKYGLSVHMAGSDLLFLENLAWALSVYFGCCVVCDASRVILDSRSPYYALLFEEGHVYLVDDRHYEDEGVFVKIAELRYERPGDI